MKRDSFRDIPIDSTWSFIEKTRKDTGYLTHSYHRYPAKFIPQLVHRLLKQYTQEGDLVVDPFGGCGTTLIEAKVTGRPSIGVDINPVAVLITNAKKTPIHPIKLSKAYSELQSELQFNELQYEFPFSEKRAYDIPDNERIDYWFLPQEKKKIAYLLTIIEGIEDDDLKNFFLCGLSNILKNSSIWAQKSNKPTRDLNKRPEDPFRLFTRQINQMILRNSTFFHILQSSGYRNIQCDIHLADARELPIESDSVSLILTSPPYVTAYEYADLHQLTALWFRYTKDIPMFRRQFIGTLHRAQDNVLLNSAIAQSIISNLKDKDPKLSRSVASYFSNMNEVFDDMKRILKKGGHACIVIGNTHLQSVPILNAEVFVEQLKNIGLELETIIKREIPSKILPSSRDPKTGRFTQSTNQDKILAYPTEYIVVVKKV